MNTHSTSFHYLERTWGRICALVALICAATITCSHAQITNYYCDGFENRLLSLDDWTISSGTWEIGVPTSGPTTNSMGRRAFAGTNCVATILAGNYTENTSSRLESKSFIVPQTNQNPRLRFWHWFNFNCGDYGQVQIKAGAGAWATLPNSLLSGATFSGYSGNTWSYPSYDLTAYAGQTVQVGFFFASSSGGGCGTTVAPGWYVDEVCVLTGPSATLTPNMAEGFEGTNFWSNWSADNGTWEWGVPNNGPPTNALGRRSHEGTNVIATILGGTYGENTDSRLVSPQLLIPVANASPRLRFWHYYSFNCGDAGYIQIKGTNGVWQSLDSFSGYSGGIWSYPSYDLSAYAGQTVQFGFYFSSTSGGGCGGTVDVGWYVDQLVVVTGTTTFRNTESFEQADFWSNWSANYGTWEWGVPCGGPGTAHEGTNVIATILCGNYGENTSSRLVSPAFVVPPKATAPRLRFWHWFDFACGDFGRVEVKPAGGNWTPLSSGTYSGNSGNIWSRPSFDLSTYSGREVQLGFYFYSTSGGGCGSTVGPGWYIDEVRLLHDLALLLRGLPVVRTQDTACVFLDVAANFPPATVSFLLQASAGHLDQLTLNAEGCWTGTITPQPNSQWLVNLQNSCTSTPMGVQSAGSICFKAISTQSAFVPLALNDLTVVNQDASSPPAHSFGTRTVIIANEPLIETWLGPNRRRMLTTYGKANTAYEIRQATNVPTISPWTLGWTNTVPASLFTNAPVIGSLSNAPILFLRANEK